VLISLLWWATRPDPRCSPTPAVDGGSRPDPRPAPVAACEA
jgi:hypothetical protein